MARTTTGKHRTFRHKRGASSRRKDIVEQQRKVDELRRQMLASRLDMRKQMEGVLTAEQRKQARQFGPWWLDDNE